MHRLSLLLVLASAYSFAQTPAHPRDAQIHDADTLAWWHTTEALANDGMEGRDTGSPAYERAAKYVADRFERAGLKPAGEAGSYFQRVPLHEVALNPDTTSVVVLSPDRQSVALPFLEQVTIAAAANLPAMTEAPLVFRGYCGKDDVTDAKGKFVLCFGTQRAGLPSAGERAANVRAAGAVGIVNIDDPSFTIEPPRWPYAYARSVQFAGAQQRSAPPLLNLRVGTDGLAKLLAGSGQDMQKLLAAGGSKAPLAPFDLAAKLRVKVQATQRESISPNILAVLPGSDPALRDQYVVIAAHLDGYGFGTPVAGDSLYNGALDDAAYVALLIQFADDLKAQKTAPKRSILFCAFTGEEKGLLGSRWFVEHPTVPLAQMAADINLDQLRPLFALKILTALAVDTTTLGATAKQVAAPMGIEIRADREPERGLLRRADHFPFLEKGVPAIGFIFGYDPGTESERRYREWYQVRYHRPQDDLTQPLDFDAAAKFDKFFYRLVETIADAPERPRMLAKP